VTWGRPGFRCPQLRGPVAVHQPVCPLRQQGSNLREALLGEPTRGRADAQPGRYIQAPQGHRYAPTVFLAFAVVHCVAALSYALDLAQVSIDGTIVRGVNFGMPSAAKSAFNLSTGSCSAIIFPMAVQCSGARSPTRACRRV